MFKKMSTRLLSLFLAVVMLIGITPMYAVAEDVTDVKCETCNDTNKDFLCDVCGSTFVEVQVPSCGECGFASDDNQDHICDVCENTSSECVDNNKDHVCDYAGCAAEVGTHRDTNGDYLCEYCKQEAWGCVTTYDEFITSLKQLEVYAEEYAAGILNGPAAGLYIVNFIRTGVERYLDGSWKTLAGEEIVGFTNYVMREDKARGTTAMNLRDIVVSENFVLPNGDQVDFGHMFGMMNIAYYKPGSADVGGWAGDLCDLLRYVAANKDEIVGDTIDEMAEYILNNYFRVDAKNAFGKDDFYGDMDGYYLVNEYNNGNGSFSELMEAYYTVSLSDRNRSAYFVNTRFGVENSQAAVRKAIYESYSGNLLVKMLESDRGISSENELREACCYAFADYLFSQADGLLVEREETETETDNEYYTVFSKEESILAPGITQEIKYAQTADGKQIVYYVATVDVEREDVTIMANYKDNDPSKGWGYQRVLDQAIALENNYKNKGDYENFNVIVATNADGYNMATGEPSGLLVMNGVEWHKINGNGFFAIIETVDEYGNPVEKAKIGTTAEYETYKDQIKEAIGGFGAVLIKDGKINVTKDVNHAATRASRTAIGIKADGSVVMMVLDGRQLPFSAGGSMEEIAQIMLDAGCVDAINLDGGGSTTYVSKPAGSDELQITNRPSDGFARGVSNSIVAVSTAKPSNEFDKAIISSEYDYITAGTSMQFDVTGVSSTGNAAIIPDDACWTVSDETLGAIDEDGVFTALNYGDVIVQFVVNDEVVGEKVIHIVIPDKITFAEDIITAIYGKPTEIGVDVWYEGYPVAFTPLKDAFVFFDYEFDKYGNPQLYFTSNAGSINGLEFIGSDAYGVRIVTVYAALLLSDGFKATASTVNLYYEDEATFDFDNATSGNRTLAWKRVVKNTHTIDNTLYRIIYENEPIEMEYTFALDLSTMQLPSQLEPLLGYIAGSDQIKGNTAWAILLQLAERICEQTHVTITVDFSRDIEINKDDLKNLELITDYFEIVSADLDEETNRLTVVIGWVNRTSPIDPDTANPLCILTGLTTKLKDNANYVNNELMIVNNGYVTYTAYLAASQLYALTTNPDEDAANKYGLYPYVHTPSCRENVEPEIGGKFSSTYAEISDIYYINSEIRKGWIDDSYYVDNQAVTGLQYIPSKEDKNTNYFYEFDEDGILVKAVSGLVEYDGALYYAKNGAPQKGWASLTIDGEEATYYFDLTTCQAFKEGELVQNEGVIFTYTFEDYKLVKGDWNVITCRCVGTANQIDSHVGVKGLAYRWAANYVHGQWVEVDGNDYYFQKYHNIADTGYIYKAADNQDVPEDGYYLFDENGVFQKNFTGIYNDRYVKNGVTPDSITKGLIECNGYYYFVDFGGKIFYKNTSVYLTNAGWNHGLVQTGYQYTFDAEGRMTTSLVKVVNKDEIDATASVQGARITVDAGATTYRIYQIIDGVYAALSATKTGENTYAFTASTGTTTNGANVLEKVEFIAVGDVSGDGEFGADDIQNLKDNVLTEGAFTDKAALAADVDGDGDFDTADLVLIAQSLTDNKEFQKDLEW